MRAEGDSPQTAHVAAAGLAPLCVRLLDRLVVFWRLDGPPWLVDWRSSAPQDAQPIGSSSLISLSWRRASWRTPSEPGGSRSAEASSIPCLRLGTG